MPAAALFAIAVAFVAIALPQRISEHQTTILLWSGALLYAAISTFKQLWRSPGFWLSLALLLALHTALLVGLSKQGFDFSFYPCLAIALCEGIAFLVGIAALFGKSALHR